MEINIFIFYLLELILQLPLRTLWISVLAYQVVYMTRPEAVLLSWIVVAAVVCVAAADPLASAASSFASSEIKMWLLSGFAARLTNIDLFATCFHRLKYRHFDFLCIDGHD